jgi:hypothetical protein
MAIVMTTRDFSLVVGTTAVSVFPTGGPVGTPAGATLSYMRIWNVSTTATIWCSRVGNAVAGGAGSFPLGPGLYEMFTTPQAIPTNALSIVSTAAGTPVTVEVG